MADPTLVCCVCHKPIKVTDGQTEMCARIERGSFVIPTEANPDADRTEDHVHYDTFICKSCFLNDPDLCRFFNKIGDRIR